MSGRRHAVVDVLARSAGAPGSLALVAPDRAWTYEELGAAVDRRAGELLGDGAVDRRAGELLGDAASSSGGGSAEALGGAGRLRRVRPVAVAPDADSVVELLAHWRAGLTPAPLDARLPAAELEAAAAGLTGAPDGAQALLWTSGSEGRPRGVALSFEGLHANVRAAARRLDLSERDVWLASLGPSHVGGLVLVVRSILLGGCLVAAGRLDAAGLSDLLDGRGAEGTGPTPPLTHLSLVPTQLGWLLEHRGGRPPRETFRCALIGGAHAPAALVAEALAAGWPLALTYGMTETCSQAATAPPELVRRKPGTVGRPLEGVDIEVAEDGELLVRGATLALGCLARPAHPGGGAGAGGASRADGAGAAPGIAPLTDERGWYHTGDYGRFDEDGDLWITGRRAERIVSGGVTVDAVEVEEALRAHPAVADVCVAGVPDREWGERVGALVVPARGELDLEELDRHLAARLAPAKRPRVFLVRPSLPVNANGKPDREAVRRLLAGA